MLTMQTASIMQVTKECQTTCSDEDGCKIHGNVMRRHIASDSSVRDASAL